MTRDDARGGGVSRSDPLFSEARDLFPGGVNSPVRAFGGVGGRPFFVDRGEGAYLVDVDGRRYVDYVLSWGPLVLGHAPGVVVDAVSRQAARGTSFGAPCEAEITLARIVRKSFPSVEMMRFVSSGTEAGMSVVRLARAFTGRDLILKFSGCYHGHADSLLVRAGSGVATFGLPDSPGVPEEVARSTVTVSYNDAEGVARALEEHRDRVAAVLVEPVVGNSGFITPEPGFLPALRRLADEHGTLLVFDEVMTGFRVDPAGAQGYYGVRPDLTMLGKVVGGGLPVGVYGGRADVMSRVAPSGPVYQAGTLSGNPLAMEAGAATLGEWLSGGVFEQTARATRRLVDGLNSLAAGAGVPFRADCVGTMFGFFFSDRPVRCYEDAKRSDVPAFRRFFHECLARGVYFAPSPFEAGFVSSRHDDEVVTFTLGAAREAFGAVRGETGT